MKKTWCIFLAIVLTFLLIPFPANAEEETEIPENEPIIEEIEVPADEFGYTGWTSLDKAMHYYGMDYTYYYCGGSLYNYFYMFSDGHRMYFGVH